MTSLLESTRNPTSVPLSEGLANRWSPRGFDVSHDVSSEDLIALLEAARWAPSAANSQPARFIVARRGTASFAAIHAALRHFNQAWTPNASVLVVAVAETTRDGKPLRYAEYDLGQAVAHLTVEAVARGLSVRQMGGFDPDAVRAAFDLPTELSPTTVVAVGRHDDSDAVGERVRVSDAAPRSRRSLAELVLVHDA